MATPNFIKASDGNTAYAVLWNSISDGLSGNSDTDLVAFVQLNAPGAPSVAVGSSGILTGPYQYAVAFVTGYETTDSPSPSYQTKGNTSGGTASATVNPSSQEVDVSSIPIGPTGVVERVLYRTKANGSTFYYLTTLADNTTTSYTDNTPDSSLGAQMPTTNTTGAVAQLWKLNVSDEAIFNGRLLANAGAIINGIYAGATLPIPGRPSVIAGTYDNSGDYGWFTVEDFNNGIIGFVNTGSSAYQGVPAGSYLPVIMFTPSGEVGSVSGSYVPGTTEPTFRNVLDDGAGNMKITGTGTFGGATLSSSLPAVSWLDQSSGGSSWRWIANGSTGFELQRYNGTSWVTYATFSLTGSVTFSGAVHADAGINQANTSGNDIAYGTINYSGGVGTSWNGQNLGGVQYQVNGTEQMTDVIHASSDASGTLTQYQREWFSYARAAEILQADAITGRLRSATNILDDGSGNVTLAGRITSVANQATSGTFGVGATLASARNEEVTSTSAQTILNFTPTTSGMYSVKSYLRVVTAATNITLTITYADSGGAQTYTPAALNNQSIAVGSHGVIAYDFEAMSGTAITLTVTAGTANQVYVTGALVGVA